MVRNGRVTEAETPTVSALVREQARRTPEAFALIDDDNGALSFADLAERSGAVAERLRRAGVERGMTVALAARRSCATFVAMLGILEAGAVCVPLDPDYPSDRLRFMLADSGAAIALCDDACLLPGGDVPTLALDGSGTAVARPSRDALEEDVGWIFYTSGSTGRPKGVMIGQSMALARVGREPIPWEQDERGCQKSSLSFLDSIWELLAPLAHGLATVIAGEQTTRDPRLLSRLIARHGVTRILIVPSLLDVLLDLGEADLASLRGVRLWLASGEPLSGALAARLYRALPDTTLVNLYGTAECWDVCWHVMPASVRAGDAVPIGSRLLRDVRIWLLDGTKPVPVGVPGELVVSSPSLAHGYLDRPALTAERFISLAPLTEGDEIAYRTGDFVVQRTDGTLELVGRRDLQVKLHGIRIELEEVERWLLASDQVLQGAVAPRCDAEGALVGLTAFVVPPRGTELDPTALRRQLGEQLPVACIPTTWVRLGQLPLMPHGKLDRSALAALAACEPAPSDAHPPAAMSPESWKEAGR